MIFYYKCFIIKLIFFTLPWHHNFSFDSGHKRGRYNCSKSPNLCSKNWNNHSDASLCHVWCHIPFCYFCPLGHHWSNLRNALKRLTHYIEANCKLRTKAKSISNIPFIVMSGKNRFLLLLQFLHLISLIQLKCYAKHHKILISPHRSQHLRSDGWNFEWEVLKQ